MLLFCGTISLAQEDRAQLIKKEEGFSHPESIIQHPSGSFWYVSNMAGNTKGDGFISRLNKDGKIETLKWITGLEDPKGLLFHKGQLYVSNNTEFIQIDAESGEITDIFEVEGAKSLNDVTLGENDNIYISDMGKNSIYVFDPEEGEVSEWLNSDELKDPNGVLMVDNMLYVGSWGNEEPGNLNVINPDDKTIEQVTTGGIGNVDGLQKIDGNSFYVSDWGTGRIFKVNRQGEKELILTAEKSSGDILYIEDRNQLVLPMNLQNAIWWYQLN
ncbi:Vgb family protein [Autumnicola musiva]|uniref:ATP-binding protein n=1 Tax=Autumnicola musiva TaxID=3075589 RepID=A0ABU3D5X8_9FLAO|nr:hypothetical protein [Zunongwangia sp. F117]MDT0676942.1 hypothetical protein [Zunongwangia sp. F117]